MPGKIRVTAQIAVLSTLLVTALGFEFPSNLRVVEGGKLQEIVKCSHETSTTCFIKDITYKFTEDTLIETTDKDLTFENVDISCRKLVNTNGDPCNVNIRILSTGRYATNINIFTNTKITGQSITFDAPKSGLIIDGSSIIDASGMSISIKGYNADQGAAFASEGGRCGTQKVLAYGKFDEHPDLNDIQTVVPTEIGSIGYKYSLDTSGGGRIIALTDHIKLYGKIRADGLPKPGYDKRKLLNGGSGGYIYLQSVNEAEENDMQGTVTAMGGQGVYNGPGGSGGRVLLINVVFPNEGQQVLVNGGNDEQAESKPCLRGGSGTIYKYEKGWTSLTVKNGGYPQEKATIIKGNKYNFVADHISIENHAKVEYQSIGINATILNIQGSSTFSISLAPLNFQADIGDSLTSDSTSFFFLQKA